MEIKLNGKIYSGHELSLLPDSFIQEWISPVDTIKVSTSGTTGVPKVVVFKKDQVIASAKMTCEYFGLNKKSNALLCLSTDFIGGKMMVVRAFISGMNLITVEPNGNPLMDLYDRIDFASMVPLQVSNSLENKDTRKKFISIADVIIGGAPVSAALENSLADCSNNIYSTFAMTETLSHIALKKLNGKDKKEYFETLPGITVSADERDCLIINAPMLNDKPVITNDVVEIVSPNRFKWSGRYDNVINSGGIKIHPEMMEHKLAELINRNRFFISSIPNEKLGQKAVMVLECSAIFNIDELKKQLEKILTKYEMPKEYYRVDKFLETTTGKIKKQETLNIAKMF